MRKLNAGQLAGIPPYLALLCMLGGMIWILLLPLDQYSRRTYISENALLPGQVHTYFGGSEQNVFRAYRHELNAVLGPQSTEGANSTTFEEPSRSVRTAKIQELFHNAGLSKTARQSYRYASSGQIYSGENTYAILQAPRGDGTEAIVLVAAIRNAENDVNSNGVPLLISLARYFSRWSLWSKDIIFLVTEDSAAGPQAWIDAYHSMHNTRYIDSLPRKSGALQGAVCIDFPFEHSFESLHVAYDGVNGQLPNLDLFNTAIAIASGQMGIGTTIQHDGQQGSSYVQRLRTFLAGMVSQAVGHATGPHSVFIPYHIDAITLTTRGHGVQDEMALGRTVESICRSLNNLLEHLHQSFFFYLLMQTDRFVSIGTYLPSAMAIAAAYTVVALWLWWKAGQPVSAGSKPEVVGGAEQLAGNDVESADRKSSAVAEKETVVGEPSPDSLITPLALTVLMHTIPPFLPIYLITQLTTQAFPPTFFVFLLFSLIFPVLLATVLPEILSQKSLATLGLTKLSDQQHMTMRSLGLLWTGACLTVLATLNFSLSTFLGIIGAPVAFCRHSPGRPKIATLQFLVLVVFSPTGLGAASLAYHFTNRVSASDSLETVLANWLTEIAFAWNVWGSWGLIVGIWVIWWPAWLIAVFGVASTWYSEPAEQTTKPVKTATNAASSAKRSAITKATSLKKDE